MRTIARSGALSNSEADEIMKIAHRLVLGRTKKYEMPDGTMHSVFSGMADRFYRVSLDDREDIVSDAVARLLVSDRFVSLLLSKRGTSDRQDVIRAWTIRACKSAIADYGRAKLLKLKRETGIDEAENDETIVTYDTENALARMVLENWLAGLTIVEKAVLLLSTVCEMSQEDIAKQLNTRKANVGIVLRAIQQSAASEHLSELVGMRLGAITNALMLTGT